MRALVVAALVVGVASSAAAAPPVSLPKAAAPALSVAPFVLTTFDGARHPAELGRLRVPEDRAREASPTITVAFVRLRATGATPGAPIVFLASGPGVPGTLLGRYPAYFALFERLRGLGDVILLDQRGTGLSEPTLQCVAKASLARDAFESGAKATIALGRIARPCVKMVQDDGHVPGAYRTDQNADDLEDLRIALGAKRLRLLSMSYGTELALAAVRRHGDRIDRIVLAGTRGPDQVWKLPSALDLQLARVGHLVALDPRYAATLPDLEGVVRRILDTLAWRPASLLVTDAKTKSKARLRVGPIGLQAILQADLSDGPAAAALPAMIATLARGDSLLFARRIERLYNTLGAGVSVMAIATDCASGGSPQRIARALAEEKTALLGGMSNVFLKPAFCELVGNPDLGTAARAPLRSETPALFVTGELDGVTSPAQAEEVSRGFPNSVRLIAENGWHETLSAPVVQDAVVDFFRGIDVRGRRLALAPTRFLSIDEAKSAASGPTRGRK